ncbi:hypothetical protein EVAR_55323_1 [Eumeta japonica]|uniref:Uncharacterized protein n=1 Tax=Eumeta variegata TaxID=151549 RepID=A0A4C1ZCF3_EUMVA|nr:hypothetical protein EVAR_55323_1 [Eumeta japonica]
MNGMEWNGTPPIKYRADVTVRQERLHKLALVASARDFSRMDFTVVQIKARRVGSDRVTAEPVLKCLLVKITPQEPARRRDGARGAGRDGVRARCVNPPTLRRRRRGRMRQLGGCVTNDNRIRCITAAMGSFTRHHGTSIVTSHGLTCPIALDSVAGGGKQNEQFEKTGVKANVSEITAVLCLKRA